MVEYMKVMKKVSTEEKAARRIGLSNPNQSNESERKRSLSLFQSEKRRGDWEKIPKSHLLYLLLKRFHREICCCHGRKNRKDGV
mmetsp:Transcript_39526/g.55694  ORF Transcript_39526/g.55694 Transcript_39526/m.55694 type:complete len:84 (-) Transcript_39526:856-1107(-)